MPLMTTTLPCNWTNRVVHSVRLRLRADGVAELSPKATEQKIKSDKEEADETPTHVILRYRGVAEQRAAFLGSPASLPEALGDLSGLLSFWSELGWLERSSGKPYQWHYLQRKVPADTETSPGNERNNKIVKNLLLCLFAMKNRYDNSL
ncbi:jg15033 [Pararge aegeria aegeria]|uniref:Jg15033 protein n=1 Tax=Pararge aegeria aegeria TaxID=348720 RepID=A0A8S4S6C9_9NEOP|nr:jg15033 [Pararge aegeria aegeria]